MTKIYDFENIPVSDRNGTYGGAAGSKEGVLIDGEYWLIKYPQKTSSFKNVAMSYTTAPLSEYIGSHIYEILSYDVHETRLGIRNNKIVVACKDFCKNEGSLREIRTIKNIYNERIEEELSLSSSLSETGERHSTDLEELLLHLDFNPILSSIEGIKQRFWDCSVIDILINNNDRNNGNWGVLKEGDVYRLAPVFDNGAAFFNKKEFKEGGIELSSPDELKQNAMSIRTAYSLGGRQLFARQFLALDYEDLHDAVRRVVPEIRKHMKDFTDFIYAIPVSYDDHELMPESQKEYYIRSMESAMEYLIEPAAAPLFL